jgi:hypothetical protein
MKKSIKTLLVALLCIPCIAFFAACDVTPKTPTGEEGGDDNGGGATGQAVAIGTYNLTSNVYSAPELFGGLTETTALTTQTSVSSVYTGSGQVSQIIIHANAGVTFVNVGAYMVAMIQGEGSALGNSGTPYDMKYVAGEGDSFSVVLKNNGSKDLAKTSSSERTMVQANVHFFKTATFTYTDGVITITMRYEAEGARTQGFTQTYTYTKSA